MSDTTYQFPAVVNVPVDPLPEWGSQRGLMRTTTPGFREPERMVFVGHLLKAAGIQQRGRSFCSDNQILEAYERIRSLDRTA